MSWSQKAFVSLLWLASAAGCASTGGGPEGALISKPAPAFSLPAQGGQSISLADYKGKVVVIDFWASWCPPCRESFPHLQKIATDPELHRQGLVVLAVNEREDSAAIRKFLDSSGFSGTVLRDIDGAAARTYSVLSLPTTVIVGRDGKVSAAFDQYTAETAAQIDQSIAGALK